MVSVKTCKTSMAADCKTFASLRHGEGYNYMLPVSDWREDCCEAWANCQRCIYKAPLLIHQPAEERFWWLDAMDAHGYKANRMVPRTVCKRRRVRNGIGHAVHALRSTLSNAADANHYQNKDLTMDISVNPDTRLALSGIYDRLVLSFSVS